MLKESEVILAKNVMDLLLDHPSPSFQQVSWKSVHSFLCVILLTDIQTDG